MAAAITADAASTGVSATAVTYALINNLTVDGTLNFTLTTDDASSGVTIQSNNVSKADLTDLRDAINAKSAVTGVTATYESVRRSCFKTCHWWRYTND